MKEVTVQFLCNSFRGIWTNVSTFVFISSQNICGILESCILMASALFCLLNSVLIHIAVPESLLSKFLD
jgi:hypothetical protein